MMAANYKDQGGASGGDLDALVHEVRARAGGVSPTALLIQACEPTVLELFQRLVRGRRSIGSYPRFGAIVAPAIAEMFLETPEAWGLVKGYSKFAFNEETILPAYVLECLLRIYPDAAKGAWIGPGVVTRGEPTLQYDADCLLIGPKSLLSYAKEGVLTPCYWLVYGRGMPGVGASGGFVEALLAFEAQLPSTVHFGVAIDPECILDRQLHKDRFTKAFIRGPKGISLAQLQNDRFPQDSRGTVTVHQRVSSDPVADLFPLLRTEFMWSKRDGLKTLVIEELLRPNEEGAVSCRYMHAIWDVQSGSFCHLDGALRIYDPGSHRERLNYDLRNYGGRATDYKKLFRLDAPIPLNVLCDLAVRFYDNNELVLEYFGGPAG